MPIIKHSLEVPYDVSEMYNLVSQVEKYSEFLPWCTASHVISQDEDSLKAQLTLKGGGFSKSFTTSNRMQKNKLIEISLINGPFKHLEGYWSFEATPRGSKINLNLEFEFSTSLLALAFSPIFEKVANTLVDAFFKRAKQVYGDRPFGRYIQSTVV
ncbi:ubiquinone-binding protein [Rickettsiella grylli]|uniref:type II toxin-antitoxin system RatA family toxin n=1 Tax=Rickettsiella grylli TaxID=59196 RepID=UPI0008FCE336|nr:type II toxin-antitoxin system RatA family toxin [Rickettsiella grylli]OIZ99441.1 ubiquinone-binding protein [Rickettsiella grylli]